MYLNGIIFKKDQACSCVRKLSSINSIMISIAVSILLFSQERRAAKVSNVFGNSDKSYRGYFIDNTFQN